MSKATTSEQNFPAWSEINRYGISRLDAGAKVEFHFHDANEYWIIIEGRGIGTLDGKEYSLGPGDMLMTAAGYEHALVVTEKMVVVYIYGVMPPHGRWGHLYKSKDVPFADHLSGLKTEA